MLSDRKYGLTVTLLATRSILIVLTIIIRIIIITIIIIIIIVVITIIINPTIIQQWLSIKQDTAIPYRGSQERALPQHGFRASYLYEHYLEHYIEDTYLCSYEHYDTLCQGSLEALPRHGFRACLCSYEHYDIRAA